MIARANVKIAASVTKKVISSSKIAPTLKNTTVSVKANFSKNAIKNSIKSSTPKQQQIKSIKSTNQNKTSSVKNVITTRIPTQNKREMSFFSNIFGGKKETANTTSTVAAATKPAAAAPKSVDEKIASHPDMFCFQCEQTNNASGCTTVGVCGKTPEVAAMQDYLVYQLKVLSYFASKARVLGVEDAEINAFTLQALFSTLTNVNFDPTRFHAEYCSKAAEFIQRAKTLYENACQAKGIKPDFGPMTKKPWSQALDLTKTSPEELTNRGKSIGIVNRMETFGPNKDAVSIQELITYGIKGLAAYAEHAYLLKEQDPKVFAFVHEALAFLTDPEASFQIDKLLGMALRVGEVNLRVMEILEKGGTSAYGNPVPTKVRTTAAKGKCILVSGHDLTDLEGILKASAGKGVNVWTHGELLPAHGYPVLKEKYPHLIGNWGGAWQNQKVDFAQFPGPIVMTTNCLIEPRKSYMDRIFTTNVTGWPGVKHINDNKDFTPVVQSALACEGFKEDVADPKFITTGFGKQTILNNAGAVVDAVKSGAIKRFFVIGGCDGAEMERNYFSDLATELPKDSMILTLGCGKYRFIKKDLGNIGPFPRVLDVGQCNDAYGAVQIAVALKNAFNAPDVNALPLSFAISWFEQKAVAVLLTLLHLGIKNIRLGPALPAFIPPSTLKILVEKFQIAPIGEVKEDIKKFYGTN